MGYERCFSEEEHVILPILWHIRHLNVFVESLIKIFELFSHHFSLFGVLELMQALAKILGLFGLTKSLECIVIILSPVRFFKFLELSVDVIGFILDDFNSLVVNVDTVFSLLDMLIKSTKEFINFLCKCFTLWRLLKLFVKLLKLLSLFGFSQIFK